MESMKFLFTCNTWRRSSGKEWIAKSPWLVRHVKQFSVYSGLDFCAKVTKPTRRTRAPSWAVSLYFPEGFRVGSTNNLNCSSDAINTRWGWVVAASPSGELYFLGSGIGTPPASSTCKCCHLLRSVYNVNICITKCSTWKLGLISKNDITWIDSTGALCFNWISFASIADGFSVFLFSSPVGMFSRKINTCPLFVPAHNVEEIVCAVKGIF